MKNFTKHNHYPCLDTKGAVQYLQGKMANKRKEAIQEHLKGCKECAEKIEEVAFFLLMDRAIGEEFRKAQRTSSCPADDKIQMFIQGKIESVSEEWKEIQTHIFDCYYCLKLLVQFMAKAQEPAMAKAQKPVWGPELKRLWNIVPNIFRTTGSKIEIFALRIGDTIQNIGFIPGPEKSELIPVAPTAGVATEQNSMTRNFKIGDLRVDLTIKAEANNNWSIDILLSGLKTLLGNSISIKTQVGEKRIVQYETTECEGRSSFRDLPDGIYDLRINFQDKELSEVCIELQLILCEPEASQDINVLRKKAKDYVGQPDEIKAIQCLKQAHELEPGNIDIVMELFLYYLKFGMLESAQLLLASKDVNKDEPLIKLAWGRLYLCLGQYAKAQQVLVDLHDLFENPYYKEMTLAFLNLAYILAGNFKKADEIFNLAKAQNLLSPHLSAQHILHLRLKNKEKEALTFCMEVLNGYPASELENLLTFAEALQQLGLKEEVEYAKARIKILKGHSRKKKKRNKRENSERR